MRLVDLFCGSGGFSRGAHQAGFEVAAAFDIDPILTSSYSTNFPNTKLVLSDISSLSGVSIQQSAGGMIDGVFGGPPCQGFSAIGKRNPNDVRRKLLKDFFRLVAEIEPTFFVMENVRGLAYAENVGELESALKLVAAKYDILGPHILDASQFGAATKRNRIFVIGTHKDRMSPIKLEDIRSRSRPPATVRQALADLEDATFQKDDELGFDVWQTKSKGRPSDYARKLRSSNRLFTSHRPTTHTEAVIERFAKVAQGASDPVGRHPRLEWTGQCPTLRAGTGVDKGSYQSVRPLHPQYDRVITVREAARLQGFPDSHLFHPTIWHSFRMIGNSVSPIMAEAIFRAIGAKLLNVLPRDGVYEEAAE